MIFQKIVSLILEQNPSFIWKDYGEELPFALSLGNFIIYEIVDLNIFRVSIE